MTVNDFMKENMEAIREVINDLPDMFDSHDFIKKFSKRFEVDYVYMLANAGSTEPFQNVNSKIGSFLSNNQTMLRIESQGEVFSENVFGNNSECKMWKKI